MRGLLFYCPERRETIKLCGKNRDTKLNVDIQENDIDGVMDEYITECSIEVKNPDAHFMFSGAYVG